MAIPAVTNSNVQNNSLISLTVCFPTISFDCAQIFIEGHLACCTHSNCRTTLKFCQSNMFEPCPQLVQLATASKDLIT